MKNLQRYQQWLKKFNEENPNSLRPDTPEEFDFKTLWIPVFSGNRTAVIDLNHDIDGDPEDTDFTGYNGNCGTPYAIIEIPKSWNDDTVAKLSEIVAKKMNKESGYPVCRVLKADDRLPLIIETINELSKAR